MPLRFAHIIAPYRAASGSPEEFAQRVTFETMRRARASSGDLQIDLFTTQFAEDHNLAPDIFQNAGDLERSVLEMGHFTMKRKLPLLRDVLDRLHNATDAEYCIYTNVDIALQPGFYASVARKIQDGFDAFVINRRCIRPHYGSLDQIPQMLTEKGSSHPGYDCFVFRRDAYHSFVLGDVCIGMGHVDLPLVCSMIAFAKKFGEFRDEYLTFHLGDDRPWKSRKYSEYRQHNDRECIRALKNLAAVIRADERLGSIYTVHLLAGRPVNPLSVHAWKKAFGHSCV